MSRPLIYQRPEQWELFEITCRTIHSRYLLSPGDEAGRRVLGVIAKAMQHFGEVVRFHLLAGTSNHLHFLLSTNNSRARSDFKCFVMGNLSKEIGDLYDWPQVMWGTRSREIVVLDEEASRNRAVYLLVHGKKEGIISDDESWPGLPWVQAVTEGRPLTGTWYNRTKLGELRRAWDRQDPKTRGTRPSLNNVADRISIPLTPLPYMSEWSIEEQRQEWRRLVEIGRHRYPTPPSPMGVERLLQQEPHTRPKETKKGNAPVAHYTDRGALDEWEKAYQLYVEAFDAHTEMIAGQIKGEGSPWAYPPGGVTPIQLPRTRKNCKGADPPLEPDRQAA